MNSPLQGQDEPVPLILYGRSFVAASLLLLVFAILAAKRGYDPNLMLAFYGGAGGSVGFWNFVTHLGSNGTLNSMVVAVSLLLLWRRQYTFLLGLILGWPSAQLTVQMLKWLVDRMRPPVPFLTSAAGSSFPSNHAAGAAFVYFYLWIIVASAPPERKHRILDVRLRESASVLLVALPAMIGYSRVYLGVHWPSDVVAGWAVGLFILGMVLLSVAPRGDKPCSDIQPVKTSGGGQF